MNTSAENGSSGEVLRSMMSSLFGFVPSLAGVSNGEGSKSIIELRSNSVPWLLVAAPAIIGQSWADLTALVSPDLSSSSVISTPRRVRVYLNCFGDTLK